MVNEHYFTSDPSAKSSTHTISVTLAGREYEIFSDSGVFSGSGLDRGTAVLLANTPPPAAGNILDLGCGWGSITLDTAIRNNASRVWAIDINERALALTRANAEKLRLNSRVTVLLADQVPEALEFQEIRSNPPIRVGKKQLHALMKTWLPRLALNGVAYMVVAKSLGAQSFTKWLADSFPDMQVMLHARAKGFHVIKAVRNA